MFLRSLRGASVSVLASCLLFFGLGCNPLITKTSSDPASSDMLAEQILFAHGDTLEIGQTFFGLGGLPSALWKGQLGERSVTIEAFQPSVQASVSWNAQTEQETEPSAKARIEYERLITNRTRGDVYPPPPLVQMETVTAHGSVSDIDLVGTQTLALPAYWTAGSRSLGGARSGIWLSERAYREIVNGSSTHVYFDLTTQAAADLLNSSKEWADAVRRLRSEEAKAAETHDPSELVREAATIDWPIIINGHSQTIKAWKAKNAFGELVILANPQNPLVLKASVNPVFPGITSAVQGSIDWNKLFGYEVRRIMLAR